MQGNRTSIDEGIAVVESGAVGQCVLAPVYSFIASESRHASIEVECLRIVADKVEIVSRLRCELRHGDTTFFGVWLIGLEILAAEAPCVRAALEHRVKYSERIAAVAGIICIETICHIRLYFHRRHTGEASLGHCLPSAEGKHGSEDNHRFSHRLLN